MSAGLDRWLGEHVREEIDGAHWIVLRDPDLIAARIDRFAAAHETKTAAPVQRIAGKRLNNVS